MKTILVTGANGLLGQKIVYALLDRPDIRCVATGIGPCRMSRKEGYDYIEMDVTDAHAVRSIIAQIRPEAVIHTAALTNVDACEQRQEDAVRMNVEAVRHMVDACSSTGSHLVHLSTDFVFDGSSGPYIETDEINPLSHYATTKALGEQVVLENGISSTIIRTIIIYGVVDDNSRSNVVLWTIQSLRAGKAIRVINDQFRSPTLAEDLAEACIQAALKKAQGVYHVSGRETYCMLDIVRIVADRFKLDASLIQPVSSAELNQPARRPPVTGFIINKAEKDLVFRPRTFLEGLDVVEKQLLRIVP